MLKQSEKIVLKSQVFKVKNSTGSNSKTPSKSPSHSPLKNLSEPKIDPNELFQKVCCPNCRYLFKIIKNNDLLSDKKKPDPKTIHTQTEQKYLQTTRKQVQDLSKNFAQSLQISIKDLPPKKAEQISPRSNNFTPLPHRLDIRGSELESHLKESTYRLQGLASLSKGKDLSRQGSQFGGSQLGVSQLGSQLGGRSKAKNETIDARSNSQQSRFIGSNHQEQKGLWIIRGVDAENSLRQMAQFCIDLPSSLEIPAYVKMLLRQESYKIEQASIRTSKIR